MPNGVSVKRNSVGLITLGAIATIILSVGASRFSSGQQIGALVATVETHKAVIPIVHDTARKIPVVAQRVLNIEKNMIIDDQVEREMIKEFKKLTKEINEYRQDDIVKRAAVELKNQQIHAEQNTSLRLILQRLPEN